MVSIERCNNGWIVINNNLCGTSRDVFLSLEKALNHIALGVTDWQQFKIRHQVKIVDKLDFLPIDESASKQECKQQGEGKDEK